MKNNRLYQQKGRDFTALHRLLTLVTIVTLTYLSACLILSIKIKSIWRRACMELTFI